jgi:hypothetical protein
MAYSYEHGNKSSSFTEEEAVRLSASQKALCSMEIPRTQLKYRPLHTKTKQPRHETAGRCFPLEFILQMASLGELESLCSVDTHSLQTQITYYFQFLHSVRTVTNSSDGNKRWNL